MSGTICLRPATAGLSGWSGWLAGTGERREKRATNPSEAESAWIRRAREGDPEAFRRLVERYRDRAYETALRIVRSPEEAEEVAQDAFVRAWRALPGFREESRFSTWLYRIVTRRALDSAARLNRRREREGVTEPARLEARATTAAPVRSSDLRRLERVLDALSPVQRAVVTLFYLRERTVQETAEILGVPPGTVKTHLHRSRGALRRAWARQEGQLGLPRV